MGEFTLQDWLNTDDETCADIVRKKYLIPKDILGREETMDEFLYRVSMGNEKIRELIKNRKFIPGGRILAGMALDKYGIKVSYSNCYVMGPPEDNIPSIYNKCGEIGVTFSRGGGCGLDISTLAPRGATVTNTAKKSSGAASFVSTFSHTSEQIGQNGRRGALLISIDDTHPDLIEFIKLKEDLNTATGANLSIRISNDFMDAVKNNEEWKLYWHREETDCTVEKTVKAKDVMRLIAKTNWDMGEPGMLFWDNINDYNLMSNDPDFKYAGTNPCGEEPLPAGGACLLGSMNVSEYYDPITNMFNTMQFGEDVRLAIEYLDTVLDAGRKLHPLQIQRITARKYRQIGLGIMGLADLFMKKKIVYGSTESLALVDTIGYTMAFEALRESCDLAIRKGQFPECNNQSIAKSLFVRHNVYNNIKYSKDKIDQLLEDIERYGLRNSALLTCAPTGTTSTIFNSSSGIEPVFALETERTTKSVYDKDVSYTVYAKQFKQWLKDNGDSYSKGEIDLPEYFVTSRNISWKDRINVQARLQTHIDASISSTVNLPESATVDDIEELYIYAHSMGCKGVTVFREGCARAPILKDKSKNEMPSKDTKKLNEVSLSFAAKNPLDLLNKDTRKALEKTAYDNMQVAFSTKPCTSCKKKMEGSNSMLTRSDFGEVLDGRTYYMKVACGHIYITVNYYNGKPVEVFMRSSKSGGCAANTNALGRMASTMLRSNIPVEDIVDSVIGIKCDACVKLKGKGEDISGLSCSDVMARVLEKEYKNCMKDTTRNCSCSSDKVNFDVVVENTNKEYDYKTHTVQENIDNGVCPDCGRALYHSGGCINCVCGFSLCS